MKFDESYLKDTQTSCWVWKKSKTKLGYGKASYNGKQITAHRLSFILNKGEIPLGLFVLHKCDNPSCVNPDHLFLGTQSDNIKDMHNKKRGCKQPNIKITDEMLYKIKNSSLSQRELALLYNVHQSTISKLKQRKIYDTL